MHILSLLKITAYKTWNCKTLQGYWRKPQWPWVWQWLLDKIPNAGAMEGRILMAFSKIKSFFSAKDAVKRMKEKPWLRKYLWNTCPIRCYYSRMCREHFKLNSQTLYNLIGKCAKYLQRCLPKKDVQMTRMWKHGSHYLSSLNQGVAAQDAQNPEHQQHRTLAGMWSNRNVHSLLVGVQNGTATLEVNLAVSYKTKYFLTLSLSHCVPWLFCQMNGELLGR